MRCPASFDPQLPTKAELRVGFSIAFRHLDRNGFSEQVGVINDLRYRNSCALFRRIEPSDRLPFHFHFSVTRTSRGCLLDWNFKRNGTRYCYYAKSGEERDWCSMCGELWPADTYRLHNCAGCKHHHREQELRRREPASGMLSLSELIAARVVDFERHREYFYQAVLGRHWRPVMDPEEVIRNNSGSPETMFGMRVQPLPPGVSLPSGVEGVILNEANVPVRFVTTRSQEPAPAKEGPEIPKIFHPEGRFQGADGKRFDYVFTELLTDPTMPREMFPSAKSLERDGVWFYQRYIERDDERAVIGRRRSAGRAARLGPRPASLGSLLVGPG